MEPGTVINGYQIVTKLGQGSYGAVYKVISQLDNKQYALKLTISPNRIPDDWIKEINISVLLKDVPYTAQLRYYFCVGYSDYYLVYDLERGDLQSYINKAPWKKRMQNINKVYKQLVNGAYAINCRGIYHSDIKPGNILYTNGRIKYNDFGISLIGICDIPRPLPIAGGTPGYQAPESIEYKITNKTDGYAVALVMLNYITRRHFLSFAVTDVYATLQANLDKNKFDSLMANHSDIVREMAMLLEPDYNRRMSLNDSIFFNRKDFQSQYIGKSYLTLSQEQQRQFAIAFKIIEQKCDARNYAVAYDCLVRYYRNDKVIDKKVIHAICTLANSVTLYAERRGILVRKTIEGSSRLMNHGNYSDDTELPPSFSFSDTLVPPKSDLSDGPPEFDFSDGPPEFDFSDETIDKPPRFSTRAKEIGPFLLEPEEYRQAPATAKYFYDGEYKYDYTDVNKKEIETELMVLYKLKGCIAGCWQDPLHRAFDKRSSREITLLLVDKMAAGADMFGNYLNLTPSPY